jgi:hypothetical protein
VVLRERHVDNSLVSRLSAALADVTTDATAEFRIVAGGCSWAQNAVAAVVEFRRPEGSDKHHYRRDQPGRSSDYLGERYQFPE